VNRRERVMAALAHCEPDRVPLSLGGTASSFTDDAYFRFREYLGIRGDVRPYRYGHTGNYYDDRILDALGTDYRYLVLTYPDESHLRHLDGDKFVDEWGIHKQNVDGYVTRTAPPPLAGATLDDLERYPFPDPRAPDFPLLALGLRERARHLYEEVDCAVVARAAMSSSFLENGAWLCGYEEFLVRLKSDRPFAARLIEKILQVQLALYDLLLDGVGEYVHVVETAEDYGTQSSLLISPATYRQMIMPARRRLNAFIKGKAPQAKILHHTCGAVARLIPDLIESGIDILNPVQPTANGMDSAALKTKWGQQLCFDGAIDTQHALVGTPAELEREVAARILMLAPGGGYSLGPSNHIQVDVPPRNVVALFELARDLGRYPLDVARLRELAEEPPELR
jgi:uroporphyrinogen decarboxylase